MKQTISQNYKEFTLEQHLIAVCHYVMVI